MVHSGKGKRKRQPGGAGEKSSCITRSEVIPAHQSPPEPPSRCGFVSDHSLLGRTNIKGTAAMLFSSTLITFLGRAIAQHWHWAVQTTPKHHQQSPAQLPIIGWHVDPSGEAPSSPTPALPGRNCQIPTHCCIRERVGHVPQGILGNTGPRGHFQLSNTLFAREVSLKTLPGKLPCAYFLLRAANAGLGLPS